MKEEISQKAYRCTAKNTPPIGINQIEEAILSLECGVNEIALYG